MEPKEMVDDIGPVPHACDIAGQVTGHVRSAQNLEINRFSSIFPVDSLLAAAYISAHVENRQSIGSEQSASSAGPGFSGLSPT
jgi:hypothetical protein